MCTRVKWAYTHCSELFASLHSKNADKNSYCVAKCTYHTAQFQKASSSSSFNIHHMEKRIKYKLGRTNTPAI